MPKKSKKLIVFSFLVIIIVAFLIGFLQYNKRNNYFLKNEMPLSEKTSRQIENPDLVIERINDFEKTIDENRGEAKKTKLGDKVEIHYIGRVADGIIFEDTYQKNQPFVFTIGDGNVVLGWEIGVEGMAEGEKRKITIPPRLAFDEFGVKGIIPPQSTIILEVELLLIK